MEQYPEQLNGIFQALADPTRRADRSIFFRIGGESGVVGRPKRPSANKIEAATTSGGHLNQDRRSTSVASRKEMGLYEGWGTVAERARKKFGSLDQRVMITEKPSSGS
jgi:hypothetical protein